MFTFVEKINERLPQIDLPIVGLTLIDVFLDNKIRVIETISYERPELIKLKIKKAFGDVNVHIIQTSLEEYLNTTSISLDDVIYFNTSIYFGNNFMVDFLSRKVRLKFNTFNENSLRRLLEYYKRGFRLKNRYMTGNLLKSLLLKKSAEAIMEDEKCCQMLKL